MATTVGRVDFEVGADGSIMERELRRIGRRAGTAAGKDAAYGFKNGFDGDLTSLAERRLERFRAEAGKAGKKAGVAMSDTFDKYALDSMVSRTKTAMREVADAFVFKDGLDEFAKRFDNASAAMDRMQENLKLVSAETGTNNLQIKSMSKSLDDWYEGAVKVEQENARLADVERRRTDALKEMRLEQSRLTTIMKDTSSFNAYARDLGGVDKALTSVRERMQALREEADPIWIDKMDDRFRRLNETVRRLPNSFGGLGDRMNITERDFGRVSDVIEKEMSRSTKAVEDGHKRQKSSFDGNGRVIKSHLARVIVMWTGLIAAIGEGTASLGSGVGAALTALISSFAVGFVGALGIAGAGIAGFATMAGLAINSLRFMKDEVPAVSDAMDGLASAAEDSGRRFAAAWGPSVAAFLNTLTNALSNTSIVDAMAKSLSQITDAFTTALQSPGFQLFYQALATTIPAALTSIGTGAASLASGLAAVFAAASPALQTFAAQFDTWAKSWSDTMTAAAQDGSLQAFFDKALTSINAILGVVGALGGALATVFKAGADTGNSMLGTLTGLFDQWNNWMKSIEGQKALETWFANGERVFNALLGLAGSLGGALADLVTPDTIERLLNFIDSLSNFLPTASAILGVFGNLDVLNIFTGALNLIGALLTPLLPILNQFAGILGETLLSAITALTPVFTELGTALAPVFQVIADAIATVLPPLIPALVALGEAFTQIVIAATPLIEIVVTILTAALVPLLEALPEIISFMAQAAAAFLGANTAGGDLGSSLQVLSDIVTTVFTWIADIITSALQIGTGIMTAVIALLQGDFSGAFTAMQSTVDGVFKFVGTIFDGFMNNINGLVSFVSGTIPGIAGFFQSMADNVMGAINGIIGVIQNVIGWFQSLFDNASKASNVSVKGGGSGGGGSSGAFASGGVLGGPRRILAGEAGPEAIVPLRRPLSQVDPSVRWLSALAQGMTPHMASGGVVGGGGVSEVIFQENSIVVQGAEDPRQTALEVADVIAERVAG